MSFVFKKKVLSSIMAATMAAGFAASQNAAAIHLAEDGIGQVLAAPIYFADGVRETEFAITNTDSSTAVKVKIVVRSAVSSTELLDFICYMTPGDVCRFTLGLDANDVNQDGKKNDVYLYSADDSVKSLVPTSVTNVGLVDSLDKSRSTFASVRPAKQYLPVKRLGAGDSATTGHVEIIGVYGVQGSVTGFVRSGAPANVSISQGMSKFDLAKIFDTPRVRGGNLPDGNGGHYNSNIHETIARNRCLEYVVNVSPSTCTAPGGITGNSPSEYSERNTGNSVPFGTFLNSKIRSSDPTWIKLMGTVTVKANGDRFSYRMPALDGAVGDNVPHVPYVVPGDGTGRSYSQISLNQGMLDGLVVSSSLYDTNVGSASAMGPEFGITPVNNVATNADSGARASKTVEIERALAAASLSGMFKDNRASGLGLERSGLMVTFPTRYLHSPGSNPCLGVQSAVHTPPFEPDGTVVYSIDVLNDFEQLARSVGGYIFSPIEEAPKQRLVEVNYFLPQWPSMTADGTTFEQGWFNLLFTPTAGCPYQGVPALGMVHSYVEGGPTGLTQSMILPLSHSPKNP